MKYEDRPFDETEHDLKTGSFENVRIFHNGNEWQISCMLGFFGWSEPATLLVTEINPVKIDDPEDNESFEIALDYWMDEQGIDIGATAVRIGSWL